MQDLFVSIFAYHLSFSRPILKMKMMFKLHKFKSSLPQEVLCYLSNTSSRALSVWEEIPRVVDTRPLSNSLCGDPNSCIHTVLQHLALHSPSCGFLGQKPFATPCPHLWGALIALPTVEHLATSHCGLRKMWHGFIGHPYHKGYQIFTSSQAHWSCSYGPY